MRVHNIGNWQELGVNMALPFRGGEQRVIEVKFNCPSPTAFFYVEDGVETFLATFVGMGDVEFTAGGGKSCAIRWEGDSPPWFITRDGAKLGISYDEMPATFTKIATRRERNPDLVRIENEMKLNELRRKQQWEDELKRRREWEAANAGNNTAATSATGGGVEDEPEGDPETPAEGASTDGAT